MERKVLKSIRGGEYMSIRWQFSNSQAFLSQMPKQGHSPHQCETEKHHQNTKG